jgi:ATP/maltotriose-dependent transcriptional regulator MalT
MSESLFSHAILDTAEQPGVDVVPSDFGTTTKARSRALLPTPSRQYSAMRVRRSLVCAWHHLARFSIDAALAYAQRVDEQAILRPETVTVPEKGEAAALRAAAFVLQDEVAHALPAAQFAVLSGATSPVALTVCRWVYWRLGDVEKFYTVKRRQPGSQPSPLHAMTGLFDLVIDAAIALNQMHFNAASVLANDALELARQRTGGTIIDVFPACVIAQALYEAGRVEDAEALLAPRLSDISSCAVPELAVRSYCLLARVALQTGHQGRAIALLEEAEALAVRRNWPRLQAASLAGQIEAHLARHCADDADTSLKRLMRLCEQRDAASVSVHFEMMRYRLISEARLALTRAPDTADVNALQRLHTASLERRDRYDAVEVALILTEALLAAGRRADAMVLLIGLIETASAVGLRQTLIDCGEPISALIEAIVRGECELVDDQRELLPYLAALMARRRREVAGRAARRASLKAGKPAPLTCLSERERTVLGLMGRGLTNKQIAIQLRIAPETVKSHAKHLYNKLEAKNRTEAVTLASLLGLVQARDHSPA